MKKTQIDKGWRFAGHDLPGGNDAVGRGRFNNRQGLDNSDSTRYLFDIFSVNTEKMNRIRFGNGVDKTIFSKAE